MYAPSDWVVEGTIFTAKSYQDIASEDHKLASRGTLDTENGKKNPSSHLELVTSRSSRAAYLRAYSAHPRYGFISPHRRFNIADTPVVASPFMHQIE